MPLQATSGAASYDAFGGGVPVVPAYIEEVFSTWLYTGNSSTQTIANGIDLLGKGGLVWNKTRDFADNHYLIDTARGVTQTIFSNERDAQQTKTNVVTSFNANGFTAGNNADGYTNASWTFRKQPKFFDIVTWTGNSTARTIAHNLGSVPGCIMVKAYGNMASIGGSSDWQVYHQSIGNQSRLVLNATLEAIDIGSACWNSTTPTSTVFSLGTNSNVNQNSVQYVAYLFAHNAGGFGLTGTDNVISCGSFNPASNGSVDLGYEPQWIIAKKATGTGGAWFMWDSMRGWPAGRTVSGQVLRANGNNAEAATSGIAPTATGFDYAALGDTWIYIAIRRGPMKVPTDATKVFAPVTQTSTGSAQAVTTNFPVDFTLSRVRGSTSANYVIDRLRGSTSASARILISNTTDAEYSGGPGFSFDSNTQITDNGLYGAGSSVIYECFRRAPSFFDEVCYTGDGTDMTINHNLGVVPELLIVKRRSVTQGWFTYSAGTTTPNNYYLQLQSTAAQANAGSQVWNNTATTFLAGTGLGISASTQTYVAYLFATCPGVSKVTNFTGTGALQTINCGFTSGARFVLIKRTDSTGNWFVWDSSRGLSSSNDPYLLLNSTAAEVTSTNWVDTTSTGFQVTAASGNDVNINGASYIALAIS